MKIKTLILALTLITACSSPMQYKPITMDRNQALSSLEKTLLQQHIKYMPSELEVTGQYFRSTRIRYKSGTEDYKPEKIPRTDHIYFKKIGVISLYKKNSLYVVQVKDTSDKTIYWYGTYRADVAKEFVNALESLR